MAPGNESGRPEPVFIQPDDSIVDVTTLLDDAEVIYVDEDDKKDNV